MINCVTVVQFHLRMSVHVHTYARSPCAHMYTFCSDVELIYVHVGVWN